jgi:hypothetical protein
LKKALKSAAIDKADALLRHDYIKNNNNAKCLQVASLKSVIFIK